jgi:putative ABC transport system substrate-binding protein
MSSRREFITLGGSVLAWPLAARAQQPERMRRVGVLMSPREDDLEAQRRASILRNGLGELGWTEGRNIHIDYRWAAGDAAAREGLCCRACSANARPDHRQLYAVLEGSSG